LACYAALHIRLPVFIVLAVVARDDLRVYRPGYRCLVSWGDGSLAWAESDDFACFFPALRAGGPEPVDVAVSAAWAGNTAQASHRCT